MAISRGLCTISAALPTFLSLAHIPLAVPVVYPALETCTALWLPNCSSFKTALSIMLLKKETILT